MIENYRYKGSTVQNWGEADMAPGSAKRHHDRVNGYQCWFCGEGIERLDAHAVMIAVENLWRWDAGSKSDEDPWRAIYAHSACAKTSLKGATMEIEPDLLGDDG